MPSFPHVAYRPSVAGPAGGLVTLSRLRLAGTAYARLPRSSRHSGIPARARVSAFHSGVLTVRLADSRVRVLNIHPTANTDGDWSEHNRFRQLQRDQFTALAQAVAADSSPTVVCGDFNVAQASTLHRELRRRSGLRDAFDGECPPTFHAEYLPPGSEPHCIDFILVTEAIERRRHRPPTHRQAAPPQRPHLPVRPHRPPGPPPDPQPDPSPTTRPSEASTPTRRATPPSEATAHPTAASNHSRRAKRRRTQRGEQPQPPSEATAPGGAGGGAPARGKRSAAAQHDEGDPVRAFRGHESPIDFVELRGFEPLASSLRTKRATNCATAPSWSPVAWRPRNSNTAMVAG